MKLKITKKAHLAICVIAALRDGSGKMAGSELADAIEISPAYLAHITRPLIKEGWLISQPGRTGGYELTADAGALSVLDVIEAVEGPTDTESCILFGGSCSANNPCATHHAWSRARAALVQELAETPLGTLTVGGRFR